MPETWTPDTLHAHFTARHDDLKTHMDERFRAEELARAAFSKDLDEWKNSSNEWRKFVTDRERTFFPRAGGYLLTAFQLVLAILLIYSYTE